MSPTKYSRRQFLSATAGLSLAVQPLFANEVSNPVVLTNDPARWKSELIAPIFLGNLGDHLFQPGTITFVADSLLVGPMDFGMNMVNEVAIKQQLPTTVIDFDCRNAWRHEASLIAMHTGIHYGHIYFGRMGDSTRLTELEWNEVRSAESKVENAPLAFAFKNSITGYQEDRPEQLIDLGCQKGFEKGGRKPPRLIVISNPPRLFRKKETINSEYLSFSFDNFWTQLKLDAEFYNAAVIVDVQKSMDTVGHLSDGWRKSLNNLVDIESLLPYTDAVLIVHHDRYFTPAGRIGIVDINVVHNLHGPTGTAEVAFAERVGTMSVL